MESLLHSLRDIEGVIGSFVLDARGSVLARDMPAMFDHDTLHSAGKRLSQLRAALEATGDGFDGCTARFGSHLVVVRAATSRTLCVLCPLGVNLNTLQMGLNLVARRVGVGASEAPPGSSPPAPRRSLSPVSFAPVQPLPSQTPSPESVLPAPPESAELVPQEAEPSRFFRGRPVR
jgi:predicted regulator of Ras-like GTPase activity (Roadblock/LC7/MglB family)